MISKNLCLLVLWTKVALSIGRVKMGQEIKKRKMEFLLEFAYISIREYGSQEGGEIADHSESMVDGRRAVGTEH